MKAAGISGGFYFDRDPQINGTIKAGQQARLQLVASYDFVSASDEYAQLVDASYAQFNKEETSLSKRISFADFVSITILKCRIF